LVSRTDGGWPPHSSLRRVLDSRDSERQELAARRIGMFKKWLGTIQELQYLQKEEFIHDFAAIAQHYGIPTHYIDFTTDPGVAGFFSADTSTPPSDGKSCIYCLNTEDLISTWETLKELDERKGAKLELININVRNLWRLQAQRGVFLCANYNWEIDYPMDKILFPYRGYPSFPTREEIYVDKSPLEQLLDQYFFIETATFGTEKMRKMIKELHDKGVNASFSQMEEWADGYYAEAFLVRARRRVRSSSF
jgi:hypothetical protein